MGERIYRLELLRKPSWIKTRNTRRIFIFISLSLRYRELTAVFVVRSLYRMQIKFRHFPCISVYPRMLNANLLCR